MPTYIVSAAAGRLSVDAKQRIAKRHHPDSQPATGAQSFFAQVIFNEVPQGQSLRGWKSAALRADFRARTIFARVAAQSASVSCLRALLMRFRKLLLLPSATSGRTYRNCLRTDD